MIKAGVLLKSFTLCKINKNTCASLNSFVLAHFKKIVAILLTAYVLCMWYCSTRISVTGDELNYFAYAVNVVKGNPAKENINGVPVFNSQMPINALNTFPRAVEQVLKPGLQRDTLSALKDIKNGRLVSILSALLLGLYVLTWSVQLYGQTVGLFSLLLYLLCPNIMAHSQFVGTDVFSFLMLTACCYHAWRYAKKTSWQELVFVATWLALAQVTKQSLLLLYPVVFVFLITRLILLKKGIKYSVLRLLKELLLTGCINIFIINAAFLFDHTGKSFNQYHFVSQQFSRLQSNVGVLGNIPLPLPEPFVAGFDAVRFNVETGPGIEGRSSYGIAYFLGKPMLGQHTWYYYPLSCLFKLPLPFILLLLLSVIVYLQGKRRKDFYKNEWYSLLPAVFIFLSFCMLNNMYLGIKNVLMILPLLFVFCGTGIEYLLSFKKGIYVIAALFAWQSISVLRYFPHFLPYTNELILNKRNAYRIFGDGNLYLQEGRELMLAYLQQHPEIHFEPATPVKGKVMLSIDRYYDWWNKGDLQWFRSLHLKPVDHFHSQYLIFEVP